MMMSGAELEIQALKISREIKIDAPIEIAFEALLLEISSHSEKLDGQPMPMVIEPWPGGRWYRDLGDNAGHFWGHVQVIKPPTLLELTGPLFMSFPSLNHVQYRLTADGDSTRLNFTHQGMGPIPDNLREGVHQGWDYKLNRIDQIASGLRRSAKWGEVEGRQSTF